MKFINKRQYIDLINMNFIRIKVKQKDNGRYIMFRILQDGVKFDLTGKTIKFFAKKPDGKEVFNNANITSSSDGECEVKLTSQTLAVQGIVECELSIYEGEEIISTFIFELDVKKSVRANSSIESSHEYTVIEEIMNKMKEWIEKTKDAIKRVDDAIKKIPPKEELIGPQGPQGPQGIQGPPGSSRSYRVFYEYFEATAGQKVFEWTSAYGYPLGINALSVYVNGARVTDRIYKERTEKSIEFKVGLSEGDKIFIEAYQMVADLRGPQGPQGIKGEVGPKGATGATGPAGKDGTQILTQVGQPSGHIVGRVWVHLV